MLRPSRALTVVLLWLAIMLLPVRVWAAVAMPMAMTGGAVMHVQAEAAEPLSTGMPCHGQADVGDTAAPQTCSMCDVCHSAFAGLPAAPSALPERPASMVCGTAVKPVEPTVQAGPERPPRSILA